MRKATVLNLRGGMAALAMLLITGCSGGGGSAPMRAVDGNVTKGPTVGATVELFQLDDAGLAFGQPIATAITDVNGQFSFADVPNGGPYLVRSSGGSYLDESDPAGLRQIQLSPGQGLQSILPAGASSAALTPFSDALVRKIRRQAQGSNFLGFIESNRAIYASVFGFDIFTTIPAKPTNPTGSAAQINYAMAIGGVAQSINQIATMLGDAVPDFEVVQAVLRDLSDGRVDGRENGQAILIGGQAIADIDINFNIRRFRNNNDNAYSGLSPLVLDENALAQNGAEVPPDPDATPLPTTAPTASATPSPSATATPSPTATPTSSPSVQPTATPTPTPDPTIIPTPSPTAAPTASPTPSTVPTPTPTDAPGNNPPVAVDDEVDANEDETTLFDVLVNDSDIDDDELEITAVSAGSAGGTVSIIQNTPPIESESGNFLKAGEEIVATASFGQLEYTPLNDFFGSETFSYTISDGNGGSDTATVTVTVAAVNDPPSFQVGADQTVAQDSGPQSVSAWASNISAGPANESGQALSFSVVTNDNPSLFAVGPAVSPIGDLSYEPAQGASGSALIGLQLLDDGGIANGGDDASTTETFLITVSSTTPNVELGQLQNGQGSRISGTDAAGLSGSAVAPAGDFNGDGFDDLVIGVPAAAGGAGRAYVLFGSAAGLPLDFDLSMLPDASKGLILNCSRAGDMCGAGVAGLGDFNGDGFGDIAVGAPGYVEGSDGAVGRVYLVFGGLTGASFQLGNLNGNDGLIIQGDVDTASADFGQALSFIGDFNRDGLDDLAIGAPGAFDSDSGTNAGRTSVLFGREGVFGEPLVQTTDITSGDQGFIAVGSSSDEFAGSSVSGGDINDDGYADLVIGAPQDASAPGRAYVLFGTPNNQMVYALSELLSEGFVISGNAPGERAGESVAAGGDVNGDGIADILIGVPLASPSSGLPSPAPPVKAAAGEVYVLYGQQAGLSGTVLRSDLDGSAGFVLQGVNAGDELGSAVASLGDMDADGLDDILIGAPLADPMAGSGAGSSYLVFGKMGTLPAERDLAVLMSPQEYIRYDGVAAGDESGSAVAAGGDVNGDGFADMLIGAPVNGVNSEGQSYLIYGDNLKGVIEQVGTSGDEAFATGGGNLIDAGAGNDQFIGDNTVADDFLVGGQDEDFIDGGGGNDVLRGASGDDQLVYVVGEDTLSLDGGSGYDNLFLTLGQNLNLPQLLQTGGRRLLRNFEAIDANVDSDVNNIVIDQASVFNVTGRGHPGDLNTLHIFLGNGDTLTSTQSWVMVNRDSGGFDAFENGNATLLVSRNSNVLSLGDFIYCPDGCVDALEADFDGDGLSDFEEVTQHSTDPRKADTDGDGLGDALEIKRLGTDATVNGGNDPAAPADRCYLSGDGDNSDGKTWATAFIGLSGLENAINQGGCQLAFIERNHNANGGLDIQRSVTLVGSLGPTTTELPDTPNSSINPGGDGFAVVINPAATISVNLFGLEIRQAGSGFRGLDIGSNATVNAGVLDIHLNEGGGVFVDDGASLVLEDSAISSNTVSSMSTDPGVGAGVLNEGSTVLRRVKISQNSRDAFSLDFVYGLGVAHISNQGGTPAASLLIVDSEIFGHSGGSYAYGGGVYYEGDSDAGPELTIKNSRIEFNTAQEGGGIYSAGFANYPESPQPSGGASLDLEPGTVIANNFASAFSGGRGGGIYAAKGMQAFGVSILRNTAVDSGGGLYLLDGTVSIINSEIAGNQAVNNSGGGIATGLFGAPGSFNLQNTVLLGNQAGSDGGGLYLDSVGTTAAQTYTVHNNLFAGNFASQNGGAVAVISGSGVLPLSFANNTVAYNQVGATSTTAGGGVNIDDNTPLALERNIIWFNDNSSVDMAGMEQIGDNAVLFIDSQGGDCGFDNNLNELSFPANIGTPGDPLFLQGFRLKQSNGASPAVDTAGSSDCHGSTFHPSLQSGNFTTDPAGQTDNNELDLGYHYQAAALASALNSAGLESSYIGNTSVAIDFVPERADASKLGSGFIVGVCLDAGASGDLSLNSATSLQPYSVACNPVLAEDRGEGIYRVRLTTSAGSGSYTVPMVFYFDPDGVATNPATTLTGSTSVTITPAS